MIEWTVYVLVKRGKAVYVGCTSDIKARIKWHKSNKEFDKHISIKKCDNKREALSVENSLIKFITLFKDSDWYNSEQIIDAHFRDLYLRPEKSHI